MKRLLQPGNFRSIISPLQAWGMRDLLRRPAESLFLVFVLGFAIAGAATALILTQALATTAARILVDAPSLVVRKTGPGGWQPIAAGPAVSSALAVAGVTEVRPRIWGVASGPAGPVTIVGADPQMDALVAASAIQRLPDRGEAVVGSAIGPEAVAVHLTGAVSMEFKILSVFSRRADIAAHDLVLLHPEDARRLLGLPEGFATDLAVFVFHEEEEAAILPELAAAFEWPVRITTRGESAGYYAAAFSRRGGLALLAFGSTLFSALLIVWFIARERTGRKHEIGLLKSMGWTTGNIVALQLYRAVFIGLAAAAIGALFAYGLVFLPGVQWPLRLLFGWERTAPALYLDSAGAALILLQITALILLPFLAAVLLPALRHAAAAPIDLLDSGDS